ncbi:hypothetical protein [Natronorarus salvus]|uniref:hypothetical protein n=1 Tax=Natronorarus salvus TaxID=3117733 RepID=UPI002F264485
MSDRGQFAASTRRAIETRTSGGTVWGKGDVGGASVDEGSGDPEGGTGNRHDRHQ